MKYKNKINYLFSYPLSSYHVRTEDGYILKLFRISGGKNAQLDSNVNKNKKVVLLQHGLFVRKK